jgi:predicted nuclease of predicted toxin-antitoxin system
MRFLIDQDVYAVTTRFLINLGHDVVTAFSIGRSRATDTELLYIASEQERILVTRDRDFGGLVFLYDLHAGVIYLRVDPPGLDACHRELEVVLSRNSEQRLRMSFVVVEPGRHRIRKLSTS